MPFVIDLKAGDHFISNSGSMFELIAQGRQYSFVRNVSTGEETIYAGKTGQVCLATESQIQQEGKIAIILDLFEDSSTNRQAAEQIIDYLQTDGSCSPSIIQEISAKYVKRCTDDVKEQDDSLLNGINALAGAAMAIAGSDTPNYKVKAARCWPWGHPKNQDETHTEKFQRVFQRNLYGEPTSFRDRLVWAAVLIIAEIEKQDRKAAGKNGK